MHTLHQSESSVSTQKNRGPTGKTFECTKVNFHYSSHRYDTDGFNFRIVATHEIGHALGLGHSTNELSIMFQAYRLFQPQDILPKDVSQFSSQA
jgi:predicted Zn-dependent protease